jgi:hypothetical protein
MKFLVEIDEISTTIPHIYTLMHPQLKNHGNLKSILNPNFHHAYKWEEGGVKIEHRTN